LQLVPQSEKAFKNNQAPRYPWIFPALATSYIYKLVFQKTMYRSAN